MSKSDTEWVDWARQNRVSFEVAPLMETRGSERVHVGFTLTLYAAVPMEKTAGRERQEAGGRLMQELRAFADAAVTPDPSVARTEWEPMRAAAVLRPENELKPEVGVTLRIFHADEYLKPVSNQERDRLSVLHKLLSDKGLRQGHW